MTWILSWASMTPAQAKGNKRSLPMACDYTVGSEVDAALEPVRTACLELVSLDRNRRLRLVGPHQAAHRHPLQWRRVVELPRPTDRELDALPLRQGGFGREQHSSTAHVHGFPGPDLLYRFLSSEHLVSYVPFDRQAIRGA